MDFLLRAPKSGQYNSRSYGEPHHFPEEGPPAPLRQSYVQLAIDMAYSLMNTRYRHQQSLKPYLDSTAATLSPLTLLLPLASRLLKPDVT